MSRYGESPLMKVSEGHNIPLGWQRPVLITGQPPLLGDSQRAKEAMVNEALQTLRGDVGSAPCLHGTIRRGVDASFMAAVMRVRKAQAIGGGNCRCKVEEAKYETLGVNPLVL